MTAENPSAPHAVQLVFDSSAEPGATPIRLDELTEEVQARVEQAPDIPAGTVASLWSGLRNRAIDDVERVVLAVEQTAGEESAVVLQPLPGQDLTDVAVQAVLEMAHP